MSWFEPDDGFRPERPEREVLYPSGRVALLLTVLFGLGLCAWFV